MKVFMTLLTVLSMSFATDMIPTDNIRDIADKFVTQRFGDYAFEDMLIYYGIDDTPNAYAFIYSNTEGEQVTIVMGARVTCTPVSEFYKGVPNYYTTFERARTEAQSLSTGAPVFQKIYYFGPTLEYYSFTSGDREFLLNTYSLQSLEKRIIFDFTPERDPEIERVLEDKWNAYFAAENLGPQRDAYVDSVPFVDWNYGCSPTASSMIFWYWDSRGYSRLVDFFYDRYDDPENEEEYNVPNVVKELALGMYTDSMSGATTNINIAPGHITVSNQNGYTFSSTMSNFGNPSNNFLFNWFQTELDAGRPTHWGMFDYWYEPWGQYINHSVCAVGYEIILPDTFIIVHDTWHDYDESWPLWTYHNGLWCRTQVINVIPGGAQSDFVDLTWPSVINLWMYEGMTYEVTWDQAGSSIDHLKMWTAPAIQFASYDSVNWTVVDDNVPNTGTYVFTAPSVDTLRINIAGLNASNARLSADGSFTSFTTRPVIASNVDLYGHNLLGQRNAQDIVVVGDYAYLALGTYGIGVVDVSSATMPAWVNTVDIGGEPRALAYDGSYLYCTTFDDSGFVVLSLSDPTTPSVVGSTTLAYQTYGLDVAGGYAYVAVYTAGLNVVSLSNPSAPSLHGSYDTPGQAYDACVVNDTVVVVADNSQDLRFLNVSDPATPTDMGQYVVPGNPRGLACGGLLFVSTGAYGVGFVDVSDPSAPDSLSWFDTDGQPFTSACRDGWKLYVADGPAGIRVLDIGDGTNPTEIGYFDTYGNTNAIAVRDGMIIIADGDGGLCVTAFTGVEEEQAQDAVNVMFSTFPNPFKSSTTIQLASSIQEHVRIVVYDVLGTQVKNIADHDVAPGRYDYTWDATNDAGQSVAAGVYLVEVTAGNTVQTQKVIFVQ
jgi:hypothetical protein